MYLTLVSYEFSLFGHFLQKMAPIGFAFGPEVSAGYMKCQGFYVYRS